MSTDTRPLVLITGVAGSIGRSLAERLAEDYRVVGLDVDCDASPVPCVALDLGDDASVDRALAEVAERFGRRIASVVHLAAYFDFTGEAHPLYQRVNVDGTRRLLDALQAFEVEQLVYTSTMLVHAPGRPGERIDEDTPIDPQWAYPRSKAAAEQVIAERHGAIPYVLLRFAGLYDEISAVPTLAEQIARIHDRALLGHVTPADPAAGQSMLHREDMLDAVLRTIERRTTLPSGTALLIGEPEAPGYGALQDRIGCLLHGEREWPTLRVPKPVAKAGAALRVAAEPLVPDALDHGEKPFIRPFMVERAGDHYALDISRARRMLGWQPRHRLLRTLPAMLARLQQDPRGWYRANHVTPPAWLDDQADDPERLRHDYQQRFRAQHRATLWARFACLMLGSWLLVTPAMLEHATAGGAVSDLASGAAVIVLGSLCLSWRFANLRWALALVACWLLFAPLLFWSGSAAVYGNDLLVGALLLGFAVAVPPIPGIAPVAALRGPEVPPGWDASPSSWMQRAPIVLLAFVGLYVSRHLAAYQLGHVDAIWDPLFGSEVAGRNGSEAITTSKVSEWWPVSDAGVGALTYVLEIVTGLIGSNRRWRTMPWLVMLFGIMIVPLGVVSIGFIIIQPIVIGTWCTLCLIAALAMVVQIPYSLDELLATTQFLLRRRRAGRPLLRVFFTGDRDDGDTRDQADDFERPGLTVLRDWFSGGVGLPWNLAASLVLGLWLMTTRLTLGNSDGMANADHLIGSLVITNTVIALSEIGRPLRWLNLLGGAALLITPFWFDADSAATVASIVCGLLLMLLAPRRGRVRHRWGGFERWIV